jgi:hypothetical protein
MKTTKERSPQPGDPRVDGARSQLRGFPTASTHTKDYRVSFGTDMTAVIPCQDSEHFPLRA